MRILVTGGAGYIGSALVAALLKRGDQVIALDDLWFGGDSLVPFLSFDSFRLIKRDLCGQHALTDAFDGVDSVVHLAAVVGFPACERAGRASVWRTNVEGTRRAYEAAGKAGVSRLIFASSYSNYGESKQGEPVTEESPLNPQSLYAESKIEAERFLLSQAHLGGTAPICLRLATVFGVSPRTRFDLMVNQFVLEAHTKEHLTLYQENFKRSFVHVRDVARAIICVMDARLEQVRGQVFNVGSENLNTSKQELAELIQARLPQLKVEYSNASFAGDMRSIHVSFDKIRRTLQFEARISLEEGIEELFWTLRNGIISDPLSGRFRNHPAILT
jgi:nucleoside-diphosphate-sugar epimerase